MTQGVSAFGTLLQIGDGATAESFTTIAEVVNISGPALSTDTIDMTHHSSPGNWEESLASTLRSGEVTFDINYIPAHATHDASTGLLADFLNRVVRNFKLVFPDAGNTTWSFAAVVTGFEPAAPHDDKLSASVTLKVSGQPTLA